MHCFNHPDIGAVGNCSSCGKGLCKNCGSYFEKMLCFDCGMQQNDALQKDLNKKYKITIGLFVAPVVFFVIGVLRGQGIDFNNFIGAICFGIFLVTLYWGYSLMPQVPFWVNVAHSKQAGIFFLIKLIIAPFIGLIYAPIMIFKIKKESENIEKIKSEVIQIKDSQKLGVV